MTLRAFDSYHEWHVLKIRTFAETKGGRTSFLGLFNIAGQDTTCLSFVDFAGHDGKSIAAGTEAHRFLFDHFDPQISQL